MVKTLTEQDPEVGSKGQKKIENEATIANPQQAAPVKTIDPKVQNYYISALREGVSEELLEHFSDLNCKLTPIFEGGNPCFKYEFESVEDLVKNMNFGSEDERIMALELLGYFKGKKSDLKQVLPALEYQGMTIYGNCEFLSKIVGLCLKKENREIYTLIVTDQYVQDNVTNTESYFKKSIPLLYLSSVAVKNKISKESLTNFLDDLETVKASCRNTWVIK